MDGAEWLRTQLTSLGCGSCGRSYGTGQIRILAQRDDLFFVDLGCATCGTRAVAVVTIQAEEREAAEADVRQMGMVGNPDVEPSARGGPAVTADEVLDMHQFMASYEGDLETLLRRPQNGPA